MLATNILFSLGVGNLMLRACFCVMKNNNSDNFLDDAVDSYNMSVPAIEIDSLATSHCRQHTLSATLNNLILFLPRALQLTKLVSCHCILPMLLHGSLLFHLQAWV